MYDAENNITKRLVYLNNKKDNEYKNLDQLLEKSAELNNIIYNVIQFLFTLKNPGTFYYSLIFKYNYSPSLPTLRKQITYLGREWL